MDAGLKRSFLGDKHDMCYSGVKMSERRKNKRSESEPDFFQVGPRLENSKCASRRGPFKTTTGTYRHRFAWAVHVRSLDSFVLLRNKGSMVPTLCVGPKGYARPTLGYLI